MRLSRILVTGTAVAALAATMVLAGAHSTPESAAAKARQGHMGLNNFNIAVLGAMAKGDVAFDAAAAQAAADNLVALSSINQMAYWPMGSSNADMEGTRALPAIWADFPDILTKVSALKEAATAMAAAAGTLEGVQANIGAVGGACGACHQAYRAPSS